MPNQTGKEIFFRVDRSLTYVGYWRAMDAEQTITEIECLERMLALPDARPLTSGDLAAANRRHDEKQAHSPWFRLWQRYGVCCRNEAPISHLPVEP